MGSFDHMPRCTSAPYCLGGLALALTPVEGARWSVRQTNRVGEMEIEAGGESGSDGIFALCQNLIRDAEVEILVVGPTGIGPVARRRLTSKTTVVPVIFTRP